MLLAILDRVIAYAASVGILGGLVFAVVAAGARAKARQAGSWPSVVGHVVRAEPGRSFWHPLVRHLLYRYEIEGVAREGNRLTLLDWPAFVWSKGKGQVDPERLRPGTTIAVRVNPRLTDDSLLDATPPPRRAVGLGLLLALACGLVLMARRLT